ncbi:helix-turn-helix domain-containing protein [Latilactobacillus curvatus]|uniref:helix-turn-helix domain-containing protein n=1 Tax=Latilactobacillus curvatus TaxID=28038 RepID=UPI0007EB642F|nr:helix-turn-helix transcriptional regulator [Latilactobacillus curvatus]ANJ69014.1 hypothetical protein FBA2_03090 [Latilactobacillus curvatus]
MTNNIRKLRLEQNVSQAELAEVLKISRQAISNYEKGLREPKLETWKKLADYFDVSVGYLQGLSDIKNPYKTDNFIYDDNGEFKRNDNFDFEMFKKEGAERVAEGNSDDLTAILNLLRKQAGDDDAENYNDVITNRDIRVIIYNTITSLVDDALANAIDLEYMENARKIIVHFNNTFDKLTESQQSTKKKDNKND